MRALILANIGSEHISDNKIIPSCFLPLYNKMTIIERMISLLNVNGFTNDDICVQCGIGGIWEQITIKEKINKLNVKIIYSGKNNILKKEVFNDAFFDNTGIIILEGNRVIDIAIISRLKRYHQQNVLVVDELHNPDNENKMIIIKDNTVISFENSEFSKFPWIVFSGVAKISEEAVKYLRNLSFEEDEILGVLECLIPFCELKTIQYDDLVYGRLNGGHSDELTGGSYSKINYRMVVKKESENEGRDKLVNEIEWLLSLPSHLKPYFSEVLEFNIDKRQAWYNVPYYGSRNLREHIFDGHLDANSACDFIEKLLDWMFENVYSQKISEKTKGWIEEKHIKRVLNRLPECSNRCPELGKIIEAERIVINGNEYRNVKELYSELLNMEDLIKTLTPQKLVMVHGDLHFQNILLNSESNTGFVLVDPRGEKQGSDIYYDLGKLWHSFHAKYDFIHSDQFKCTISWKNEIPYIEYSITNLYVEKVYDEIYMLMRKRIKKYSFINDDANWEMKVLFAEASHLCSVSVFHIHKTKTPERAIVMYLIGVILINEFFKRYIE